MEQNDENIRLQRTLASTLCEVLSGFLLVLALVLALAKMQG